MADTLFLSLGLCGNLYGFGMLRFQARIIFTRGPQLILEFDESSLPTGMFLPGCRQ